MLATSCVQSLDRLLRWEDEHMKPGHFVAMGCLCDDWSTCGGVIVSEETLLPSMLILFGHGCFRHTHGRFFDLQSGTNHSGSQPLTSERHSTLLSTAGIWRGLREQGILEA